MNDTAWTEEDDVLLDSRAAGPQFPPRLIGFDTLTFTPLSLFLHFWPVSLQEMVAAINANGAATRRTGSKRWKLVSVGELLVWLGIFFAKSEVNFSSRLRSYFVLYLHLVLTAFSLKKGLPMTCGQQSLMDCFQRRTSAASGCPALVSRRFGASFRQLIENPVRLTTRGGPFGTS